MSIEREQKDNQREDTLIAYLAGIIDGEGTIGIKKHDEGWVKFQPYISFVCSNRKVVEMIADFIDGNLYCNPSDFQNRQKKICYRTSICGTIKPIKPLEKLLPYLVIKKEQAELALKFCKEMKRVPLEKRGGDKRKMKGIKLMPIEEMQWRESLWLKCRELNALGRPQRLNEETPLMEGKSRVKR